MQNANANVPFIKRACNHQRVVLLTNIERGKSNREISFNGTSSVPHVALRIQIATRVRCAGLPGHFLLRGKVFTLDRAKCAWSGPAVGHGRRQKSAHIDLHVFFWMFPAGLG